MRKYESALPGAPWQGVFSNQSASAEEKIGENAKMNEYEILKTMGVIQTRLATSILGKKEPVAHPCNCKTECPYGYGRSFCFPCMAKIMSERNASKKAAAVSAQ